MPAPSKAPSEAHLPSPKPWMMSHKLEAEGSLKMGHNSLYLRGGGCGFKTVAAAIAVLKEQTRDNFLSTVCSMLRQRNCSDHVGTSKDTRLRVTLHFPTSKCKI